MSPYLSRRANNMYTYTYISTTWNSAILSFNFFFKALQEKWLAKSCWVSLIYKIIRPQLRTISYIRWGKEKSGKSWKEKWIAISNVLIQHDYSDILLVVSSKIGKKMEIWQKEMHPSMDGNWTYKKAIYACTFILIWTNILKRYIENTSVLSIIPSVKQSVSLKQCPLPRSFGWIMLVVC